MPSPEDPKTMYQIAHCIKGLGEAARAFDVPVVSGNVSLYNQTQGQGIQPTPTLAVVGILEDVTRAVPSHFRRSGDTILLVGTTNPNEVGGSAYLATTHGIERGALPELNYTLERTTCDGIRSLIDAKLLASCHDISEGGLGIALAECCFKDYEAPLGAQLTLTNSSGRPDGVLFAETGARFIVSCAPENTAALKAKLTSLGLTAAGEGKVGGSTIKVDGIAEIDATTAFKAWFTGLDQIFEG
jgi:phosphoribosylformylglycinamidine synthase